MSHVTAQDVRSVLLLHLQIPLAARGLKPDEVPDHFDLLTEGVLDSLGIVELIAVVEKCFDLQIDFEDLDPENLTIVGPFCRYIESKSEDARGTRQGPTPTVSAGDFPEGRL